ncbi:MAG: glycosyltransferase family 4 protein [Halobacteriaceae archaeon]
MRVCLVTSRYPPHAGGVETHVAALATRLADRGHDVTVRTGDRELVGTDAVAELGTAPRERRHGVDVRRHRSLAPGGAFHVAPGIAPALRRSDPDVVHAHNYHSLPLLFAALGRAPGVPLVATPHYHGGSADALRDRLLTAYEPLGGWALRRADAAVAVSGWERDVLARDLGVDATVVPNGVEVERFAGADPARRDRPYLLAVGRLEGYKHVQDAVRALVELPEFDLLVAGTGPAREDLAAAAHSAGVADRVEFLGFVAEERLPGLYAGAAAHVQLSAFEAYGVTVAEALAAGTPCVVSTEAALADWAERDDCVGVADRSPAAVAAAVRDAVTRDAPAEPLPTWEGVVDEVLAVYERVQ